MGKTNAAKPKTFKTGKALAEDVLNCARVAAGKEAEENSRILRQKKQPKP